MIKILFLWRHQTEWHQELGGLLSVGKTKKNAITMSKKYQQYSSKLNVETAWQLKARIMDLWCSKFLVENPIKLKKLNVKTVCSQQFSCMSGVGKAISVLDKELRQVKPALPTAFKISLVPIKEFRDFEFSRHFIKSIA